MDIKQKLTAMRLVSKELSTISFPHLTRPNVAPADPRTKDLIEWAVKVYSFSILSHYRELFATLIELTESGRIPAAFVIARCLFEMAAHAHYVNKHVRQSFKADDFETAWNFLKDINMGNLYMRSTADNAEQDEIPIPRHIRKIMNCFNEFLNGDAVTTYSFLSEFAHPNMAAFSHYYRIQPRAASDTGWVEFVEPEREPSMLFLPYTSISIVSLLHFTSQLLTSIGETEVGTKATEIADAYMKVTKA